MNPYFLAVASFLLFGLMPIFWSLLAGVDSTVILFHRCFWISLLLVPYLFLNVGFAKMLSEVKKNGLRLLFSSIAIGANWLGYIFAVNNGYVFEGGLAYYISPILSVGLGVLFLKENLTRNQMAALLLIVSSIVYLLMAKGIIPYFALMIALSFAIYGVFGKVMQMPVFIRMFVESSVIALFLSLFLKSPLEVYKHFQGALPSVKALLFLSGPVTILPMGLYLAAAKKIKFSTFGILGFILPTIVFFLSIFYFKEEIDLHKLIMLLLILLSVILYVLDIRVEREEGRLYSARE